MKKKATPKKEKNVETIDMMKMPMKKMGKAPMKKKKC